jgi:Transposase DDE domain
MGHSMTSVTLGYFGDVRREAVGAWLYTRLLERGAQGVSVRGLGQDRAGEIRLTRFLHNDAVKVEEMVASAAARTEERCIGLNVSVLQDTTVVRSEGGGGLFLHVAIAVDADDGTLLGLVYATFLTREHGRRASRTHRPIKEKESQRWLDGAAAAMRVCARARSVRVIADRESDIYEALACRPPGVDLLVRAAQDRALDDGKLLFARLDAQPKAGCTTLEVPAKPGQKARTAVLAVRFMPVTLKRPRRGPRGDAPRTVSVFMVDLREVRPPRGVERLHWRLLTTQPVTSLDEALAVADLYRGRWAIEQLFRTMKTQGFDIEALRMETDAPRSRLVAATLVAAIAVQQMLHARDGGRDGHTLRPMTDVFQLEDRALLEALNRTVEGATDRQKNPHPAGSLAYATWVCGRLGGWTGYYGQPGPIVLLRGWNQVQAAKRTLNMMHNQNV